MPEKEILKKNPEKRVEQFSALYEVGKSISSTLDLDEVLRLITKKAAQIMFASSCSLRLLDDSCKILILKCSYGLNKDSFRIKKHLKVGESIAGKVIKDGSPYLIINDLCKERNYKYPHLVVERGLRSLITVPLKHKDKTLGVLSIYNKKPGSYTEDDAKLLFMFASQAAIAIENARLYKQVETSYLSTIRTLSNIIDAKDNHIYGHSERVSKHCMKIAEELRLSDNDKEILRYASLLHDIGKIGIDIGIIRKPSKLNKEEWKFMAMHPMLGSNIVNQIDFLKELAPLILRHHERYDGKGYPGKIRSKDIPLGARILSVTDAYESMVSNRPYRKALSYEKAQEELLNGAGTQFDPQIVKVFLKVLGKDRKRN